MDKTRLALVCLLSCILLTPPARAQVKAEPSLVKGNQRVVIAMVDGMGPDYVEQSSMPVLKGLSKGFTKIVASVMPSVTNVNNASIATSTWPEEHGIIGNSFFDEARGQDEYMESSKCMLRSTLFERAAKRGVKSALLTIARRRSVYRGRRSCYCGAGSLITGRPLSHGDACSLITPAPDNLPGSHHPRNAEANGPPEPILNGYLVRLSC